MKYIEIYVKNALAKSKLENTRYALNPYIGCEHRCVYCYAPYVLHIPLDEWNSVVYVKRNIPTVLNKELKKKEGLITIGTVTDAYQPAEKKYEITRRCLEVLKKHRRKISILTKSSLILRDKDIIKDMDAEIGVTLTTLDDEKRRKIEPYASSVDERLEVLREFSKSNRTYAFIGPIFPDLIMPHLRDLMQILEDIGVSYVIFDKFRMKKGMKIPESLKDNTNYWTLKREIYRIVRNFTIPFYFGW